LFETTMAAAPAAAAFASFSANVHAPRRTTATSTPGSIAAALRIVSTLQARPIQTASPVIGPVSASFG